MTNLKNYFQIPVSYKTNADKHSSKKLSNSCLLGNGNPKGDNSHDDNDSGLFSGGKPSHGGRNIGLFGGGKPKGDNSHDDNNSGFLNDAKPSHGGHNIGLSGGGKSKGDNSYAVNQVITGTSGNDTLQGNCRGIDTLVGTTGVARGIGERDTLIGGNARDTFVLGDAQGSFYLGHGSIDYAEIKNFNLSNDNIQLAGSIQDYSISYAGGISSVFHKDACGCLDLVAQVNSACSPLDLNGNYFQYVPQSGGNPVVMF